jgi:hypothetical protein
MMAGSRRFVTLAILLAGLVLGCGAIWFKIHTSSSFFAPAALLARFPSEDALVLSADFATLRRAGLLNQSKAALEPEYKQFVDGSGFDYKRDLDFLVASFSRSGTFFIARGRFDWKKLRDYAAHQGGSCYQDLCRMQGSIPERHISFLPLRDDALALAVSTNDLAVTRLTNAAEPVTGPLPSSPVWLSVPGEELRRPDALPEGLHVMLSGLTNTDRVVVTLGPAAQGIEAQLIATCRTQDDARVLMSQLRVHAGVLAGGSFDQKDRNVTAKWPIPKSLLDSLTNGL